MIPGAVEQNWFATFAILAWPAVALWLYSTRPVNEATLWTIFGAYLLLPHRALVKLAPGIPQLDKTSIAGIAALIGCILVARRRLRLWNGFGTAEILILVVLLSPLVSTGLNLDPIQVGGMSLQSLDAYEGLSAVEAQFFLILPFLLGRQLLRTSKDFEAILHVLVIAGLLYSLPMLYEIKMSPQLHEWVYGYSPSDFPQNVRGGGFRPVVFVGHGLSVAFFTLMASIAATALWRTQNRASRFSPKGVAVYLYAILALCRTFSAFIFAGLSIPLVRWANPRLQMRVALILVSLTLLYPALRAFNLFPAETLVDTVQLISPERAGSLKQRFDQEKQLLERARERVMFGWGRFGRSRVYDEWGIDVSVTDGRWIVTLGQFGLVGFLAEFGLLAFPVFRAAGARRFASSAQEKLYLAALSVMISLNIVDLVPNALLAPWTWLLAGALLGRAELLAATSALHGKAQAATFRDQQKRQEPVST